MISTDDWPCYPGSSGKFWRFKEMEYLEAWGVFSVKSLSSKRAILSTLSNDLFFSL